MGLDMYLNAERRAEGMAETVEAVERCIRAAIEVGDITFRYQSSW